jgi:3-isopropylmalate dehydrogenase
VERCCRVAAALAKTMGEDGKGGGGPATVWSSDKANVLATGRLWRRVTTQTFEKEFPDVPLKHQLADSLSLMMVKAPTMFNGVIHTDNTFGDMLSDQAGGVVGTLGVLPSASLCGVPGPGKRCNGENLGRSCDATRSRFCLLIVRVDTNKCYQVSTSPSTVQRPTYLGKESSTRLRKS